MKFLLKILIVIFIFTIPAHAKKTAGTVTDEFILIRPSVEGSACGNSYSSVINPLESFHYNPASISKIDKHYISFFHNEYLIDMSQDAFTYLLPVNDKHKLGFVLSVFNFGSFTRTEILNELPVIASKKGKAKSSYLSLGYALNISEKSLFGAKINLVSEDIGGVTKHTVGCDIGYIIKGIFIPELNFGMAVKNISTRTAFDEEKKELPRAYTGSLTYTGFNKIVSVMVDADYIEKDIYLKYGTKINIADHLFLYCGHDETNEVKSGALNFGAGVNISNLEIKYAYQPFGELGNSAMFSIGYSYLFNY